MQSSQPGLKFIVDENVRSELYLFLKESGFDVKTIVKGASDKKVALISKREKRIIVTNDQDFTAYSKDMVFAIILLRISQKEHRLLLISFGKLVRKLFEFSGKLIVLKKDNWEEFPLEKVLKKFPD